MAEPKEDNICGEHRFNEIFRKHSKDLYQFLYYKYGADNNPQDLVQEAFVKLWNNCHKIVPAKAKSFLFTVANNQMLTDLAKKKTAQIYASQNPSTGHSHEHPQYVLEEQEYSEKLTAAIGALSEEQRVAFLLNRIEGKKHQEIAEMLGISRKAVEKRISTALANLRKNIEYL